MNLTFGWSGYQMTGPEVGIRWNISSRELYLSSIEDSFIYVLNVRVSRAAVIATSISVLLLLS